MFCCQKALFRSYKSEPFLGVIISTQRSSSLTQNCKLTLWLLHVKGPVKVRAWPLWAGNWAVWTTDRHQLILQNTVKHSEHLQNDNPAFGWTLLYLQRTMKCMNKALWGSAGSLIYYTHVKPPTFILCIAWIQQRIWLGLSYFISIFFTQNAHALTNFINTTLVSNVLIECETSQLNFLIPTGFIVPSDTKQSYLGHFLWIF